MQHNMQYLFFQLASATLALAIPVDARYRSGQYGTGRRFAGGAIAGIVIGCIVFAVLLCLICTFCVRRRRVTGGYGIGSRPTYAAGPAAGNAEAGYGQQAGWNANAPATAGGFSGGYQPPAGSPPGNNFATKPNYAPPPGPPPAAYTRH